MNHRLIIVWIALAAMSSVTGRPLLGNRQGRAAGSVRLVAVDEARQDPSFAAFRKRFTQAVRSRDATALLAASTPDLQKGFREWLDLPATAFAPPDREARDWRELERLLPLGGSFTTTRGGQKGRREFCGPYTYSEYPMPYPDLPGRDLDNEGHGWVVLGANVPVRARPNANARILTRVRHDLVMQIDQVPGTEARWYRIVAPNGTQGWIPAAQLRDPADYHACFAQIDGVWKMTAFATGLPPG